MFLFCYLAGCCTTAENPGKEGFLINFYFSCAHTNDCAPSINIIIKTQSSEQEEGIWRSTNFIAFRINKINYMMLKINRPLRSEMNEQREKESWRRQRKKGIYERENWKNFIFVFLHVFPPFFWYLFFWVANDKAYIFVLDLYAFRNQSQSTDNRKARMCAWIDLSYTQKWMRADIKLNRIIVLLVIYWKENEKEEK